jgi:hypothetical protein
MEPLSFALLVVLRWVDIMLAPLRNLELLWIIVPIYVNWILIEYLQRRKFSFSTIVSNGFVIMWVGLDWSKTLFTEFIHNPIVGFPVFRLLLSVLVIVYGLFILIEGLRGKNMAIYLGRIRETSYFMLTLTPLYYGFFPFDIFTLLSILLFFPAVYFIVELVIRLVERRYKHRTEPKKAKHS